MQIVTALALLRATREISGAVREIQRDIRPLIDKATRMTDDAARVTALALVQVERVDRLVSSLAVRIEETVSIVQSAVGQPIKQGATIIAAFRAVFAAVREWQGRQAAARDDEDPLFVG
jgi:phosphohistidine phosphatase SixA